MLMAGKVRELALALVARSLALFRSADAAQRELATVSIFARFKEAGGLLASLEAMAAGSKEFGKDKVELARSAVQAWGALAAVLDGRVVKSGLVNQFLKVTTRPAAVEPMWDLWDSQALALRQSLQPFNFFSRFGRTFVFVLDLF